MTCIDSDGWTNDNTSETEKMFLAQRPSYGMQVIAGKDYDGATLTTFKAQIQKASSPTGTLYAYLFTTDSGTTPIQISSNSYNIASLSSGHNTLEFTFNGVTLAAGNCVVLWMIGGSSDASNYLSFCGTWPQPAIHEYDSVKYRTDQNWGTDTYILTFSICGDNGPSSSGTLLPPPPAWVKI